MLRYLQDRKEVRVPKCLCDPGACASVMPLELYKVLDLGPLQKTTDTFHIADKSTVSMVGIAEDVMKTKEEESVEEVGRKEIEDQTSTPQKMKKSRATSSVRKNKAKKETTKMVKKKKKPEKGKEERITELKCVDFKDLIGKLKRINNALVKDGGIGVHLIEDNSKWK
ncbi:hypothetical protein PIB30_078190 [Stylosanthes scabra]|uniref:Uncharacterized protein n=1 Tax=Stylosanthes scabra TaxID=79078 RepID=A0ABU6SQV4_9FABA|nr:hypothetical protein [Stylosanthes scabra]